MTEAVSSQTRAVPSNITTLVSDELADMLEVKEAMTAASKVFEVVIPVTIAIILVIGLVGNLMVIFVTVMTQRIIRHPVHSMLVLNLAVADILYLVFNAPYYIVSNISHKWAFTQGYCTFYYFASNMTVASGIFTMCSLGCMRFMALMYPFKFQNSMVPTHCGRIAVIVFNWVAALIIALPCAVYVRLVVLKPHDRLQCTWSDKSSFAIYSIVFMIFTYCIPFVLVTVLYILISREMLYFVRRKANIRRRTSRRGSASYRKTTVMVMSLIFAFLICWLPHNLHVVLVISKKYSSFRYGALRYILKMVGRCTSYAHACVNPIIYTFASPDFRGNRSQRQTDARVKKLDRSVFSKGQMNDEGRQVDHVAMSHVTRSTAASK